MNIDKYHDEVMEILLAEYRKWRDIDDYTGKDTCAAEIGAVGAISNVVYRVMVLKGATLEESDEYD